MKTRAIKDSDIIVIDYETTGLVSDPLARVFSFSLTWVDDGYTEIYRKDVDAKVYDQRIKEFWASPCEAVAHNLMFELHMTIREGWGINPKKQLHDTMIMHQYMDNLSMSNALDYLAKRYAGIVPEWEAPWKEVKLAAKIYKTFDLIPADKMHTYQIADGEATACLFNAFRPQVEPWDEYLLEIELIKTTVRMERRGFMVERTKAKQLIDMMTAELESNKIDVESICGRPINLNSPKQLSRFLFVDLGLPDQGSVDNESLEKLRDISDHPILDCVLKARAYERGISTIQSYLDSSTHDGAVHPNIRTNKARTGRETSDNPNMQNVSKEMKAGAKYTVPARRCFRARPGYFLLLADYAGIEMRLGVQGTRSERLIQLCHENFDFHDACASAFYGEVYSGCEDKKKKKAMRNRAKNARFAMFYGAGIAQTAKTLGLSFAEVKEGYARDREVFPEFYSFMDSCAEQAKKTGYIENYFGRKLKTEHDRPYTATDYCIQGSAAALFKHAQVVVDKYLQKTYGDEMARIIIPVHDELVMEIHRSLLPNLNEIMVKINKLMTTFPQITVPIKVEFNVSMYTWDAKKEVTYGE